MLGKIFLFLFGGKGGKNYGKIQNKQTARLLGSRIPRFPDSIDGHNLDKLINNNGFLKVIKLA